MKKVYVGISCIVDTDGNVLPLRVKWKDGRIWEIERVLHTCRSPDDAFDGVRYTVLIGGAEKYLYRSRDRNRERWYVNAPTGQDRRGG